MYVFFFFKQKTAYEMRISDWSSDVCSSDLFALSIVDQRHRGLRHSRQQRYFSWVIHAQLENSRQVTVVQTQDRQRHANIVIQISLGRQAALFAQGPEIGRASCRERVCQYV